MRISFHGEPGASRALAALLARETGARTFVPEIGDAFDLDVILAGS